MKFYRIVNFCIQWSNKYYDGHDPIPRFVTVDQKITNGKVA